MCDDEITDVIEAAKQNNKDHPPAPLTAKALDKIGEKLGKIKERQQRQELAMVAMQEQINTIKDDVRDIKQTVGGLDSKFDAFKEEFKCFANEEHAKIYQAIERKAADKWVERAMITLISILALAALYMVLMHSGLPTP
jgi:archaellum component FlaC